MQPVEAFIFGPPPNPTDGVFILGKDGDPQNDNTGGVSGAPLFNMINGTGPFSLHIRVAAGDYEDVRLRLKLGGAGTDNCDGNEWNVAWEFFVN